MSVWALNRGTLRRPKREPLGAFVSRRGQGGRATGADGGRLSTTMRLRTARNLVTGAD